MKFYLNSAVMMIIHEDNTWPLSPQEGNSYMNLQGHFIGGLENSPKKIYKQII